MTRSLLVVFAILVAAPAVLRAEVAIDGDYPGGNILVDRIEGDTAFIKQDLRDTQGWWFYWNFRVRGAAGKTMTFRFSGQSPLGVRGPAVSLDEGKTWKWLGADSMEGASFTYAFGSDQKSVRFCMTMPYQDADLTALLDRYKDNPNLRVVEHARTRKDRVCRRVHFGKIDGEPAYRVALYARHHACESMASYLLEGIIEQALADDADGRWLRENVEFMAVPIVDLDGVEDGDQGKNRKPHDHNRDYLGESLYPTVAAIRQFVPKWSQGKLKISIDLHCPWIRGGNDEHVFFVGVPEQEIWKNVQRLSAIIERDQQGELKHFAKSDVPWGKSWNTMKEPKSNGKWAARLPDIEAAGTIEISYANADGKAVTAESARDFGRDVARGIKTYLTERE